MKVKGMPPPIAIAGEDHDRLTSLAVLSLNKTPGAALLLEELSRARVVGSSDRDSVGVAMNDLVDFRYDDEVFRGFRLVYPGHADIANGCISILTPVGAMLLGLGEGQSMSWVTDNGHDHELTVLKTARGPLPD